MDRVPLAGAVEPVEWLVVFHPETTVPLVRWLCWGRFKHVSAWGYYPGIKAWLIFDPSWDGLRLSMIPHDAAHAAFREYTRGCEIVKLARAGEIGLSPLSRLGFWCVPAIKHLLGVRCASMRPDAFYRHILRRGGIPIGEQNSTTSARCEPAS